MNKIPLMDLKAQYESVAQEVREKVVSVLDSGAWILGPEVKAFEEEFAMAQGAPHAVGVSTGTDALLMALQALGIGPGDEVIVPSFTFIASAAAVSAAGAKPVLVDVDPVTLTLDPVKAEAAITSKTKALMPVHIFGYPANMDALRDLASSKGLKIVEDCAQAHMTFHKGRMVGTIGDIGAFSFYPSKNLGAAGDGGAVTTRAEELAEACRQLRHCGRETGGPAYRHVRLGFSFRLDSLQAAVLRVKLARLPQWTQRRREIASMYNEGLKGLPVRVPDLGQNGTRHSFHLYVIRTEKRDALAKHLTEAGIGNGVYYPIPVHLQPAYADLGHKQGDMPETEKACADSLALPVYAELTDDQAARVCETVRKFF